MSRQLTTIKLSKGDGQPWGFRLQGGKDWCLPLSVSRVNPGSLADQAGLRTGDIIVKIQGQNAELLLHKEAQDVILRAGNYLDITVMRHGSALDVKIPPPVLPRPQQTQPIQIGQSMSGQHHHSVSSSHGMPMSGRPLSTSFENPTPISSSTLPLAPPLSVQKYNCPIGLYSMKNIKEAIDAHSQVLAPGVKGINFMKPDASVNTHSPVYQAVLEEEAKAQKIKTCGPGSASSPFMESSLLAEQQYHEVLRDTSLSPSVQSSSFRRLQENFGGGESIGSSSLAAKQQPLHYQQSQPLQPQQNQSVSIGGQLPSQPTTTTIPISMPTTSPFNQPPPSSIQNQQQMSQASNNNPISMTSVTAPSNTSSNLTNNNPNSQPQSWMEMMNDKRNKCPTCGQTLPRN